MIDERKSFFEQEGSIWKACDCMRDKTPIELTFRNGTKAQVVIRKLTGDYMVTRFIRDGVVDEDSKGFQELDDIVDVKTIE